MIGPDSPFAPAAPQKIARPRRVTRAGALLAATAIGALGLVGCGGDEETSNSFCAALRSAPTLESVVSGFTGLDGPELSRRLDRAAGAYKTVEKTAPEKIRGEVRLVVRVVEDIVESVRANPEDPNAAMASVRRTVEDQTDLIGASSRVASYASTECDLDLNPGASLPTTTTTR